MPKRRRNDPQTELARGLVAATIARYPREFVGMLMAAAATVTIFVNALFLQSGPHPAPIFATRPFVSHPFAKRHPAVVLPRPQPADRADLPSGEESARSQAQTIMAIQRALAARGFYQGAVDGIWGNHTDAAARAFIKATGLKIDATPGESFLRAIKGSQADAPHAAAEPAVKPAAKPATKDPIAGLIGPSKRVLAVQHALADFGYGQIKPTGVNDGQTRAAIEKFERERHLPADGKISGRFLHELAAMTGRSLEQ